jgi:hypothetical protein
MMLGKGAGPLTVKIHEDGEHEKAHPSAYDGSEDKNRQIQGKDTGSDSDDFIRYRSKSGSKNNPEAVLNKIILYLLK